MKHCGKTVWPMYIHNLRLRPGDWLVNVNEIDSGMRYRVDQDARSNVENIYVRAWGNLSNRPVHGLVIGAGCGPVYLKVMEMYSLTITHEEPVTIGNKGLTRTLTVKNFYAFE